MRLEENRNSGITLKSETSTSGFPSIYEDACRRYCREPNRLYWVGKDEGSRIHQPPVKAKGVPPKTQPYSITPNIPNEATERKSTSAASISRPGRFFCRMRRKIRKPHTGRSMRPSNREIVVKATKIPKRIKNFNFAPRSHTLIK